MQSKGLIIATVLLVVGVGASWWWFEGPSEVQAPLVARELVNPDQEKCFLRFKTHAGATRTLQANCSGSGPYQVLVQGCNPLTFTQAGGTYVCEECEQAAQQGGAACGLGEVTFGAGWAKRSEP